MRRALRTHHEDIVAANAGLLSTLPNLDDLDDPTRTCWGCGNSGRGLLTRAHVVPARFGGRDEPVNYFLLCDFCHDEQPDAASREVQIEWLRGRESCRARHAPKVTRLLEWLQANGVDLDEANEYVRGSEIRAAIRSSSCSVHGVADTVVALVKQRFLRQPPFAAST